MVMDAHAAVVDGAFAADANLADVLVVASGGLCIPAHSSILGLASPVLERMLNRPTKKGSSEKKVKIQGVPCNAVAAFVRFLYTSEWSEEEIDKYGVHLLVLSHVYGVPAMKRACQKGLAIRLTAENVVDMLELAGKCDAPWLAIHCMKVVAKQWPAVERSEAWKFVRKNDPWLELHVLQLLEEFETRKKKRLRKKKDQKMYIDLSEAMECLEHIYSEGCTGIGPHHIEPSKNVGPCKHYSICKSLQLLLRHFAACKKRIPGGCSHCKRMWQLLRLHSSVCDHTTSCKVPLCREFKKKTEAGVNTKEEEKWKLLVRKVVSAKALSCLSKRKRNEEIDKAPFVEKENQSYLKINQISVPCC